MFQGLHACSPHPTTGQRRRRYQRIPVLHHRRADPSFGRKHVVFSEAIKGKLIGTLTHIAQRTRPTSISSPQDRVPPHYFGRRDHQACHHRSLWRTLPRRPLSERVCQSGRRQLRGLSGDDEHASDEHEYMCITANSIKAIGNALLTGKNEDKAGEPNPSAASDNVKYLSASTRLRCGSRSAHTLAQRHLDQHPPGSTNGQL